MHLSPVLSWLGGFSGIRIRNAAQMLLFDGAWLWLCWRLSPNRRLRAMAAIFFAGEVALMLLDQVERSFPIDWERKVPRVLSVTERIWHWGGPVFSVILATVFAVRHFYLRRKSSSAGNSGSLPAAESGVGAEAVAASGQGASRREFIGAAVAWSPVLFTATFTSVALRQTQVRLRRVVFPIAGLPRHLDGLTIAQISDVHVGQYTSEAALRTMVQLVNNSRPDLVVFTGDLINRELSDLPEALKLIQAMPGRYGQYIIEGNHDLFVDGEEFRRQVRISGIPLLLDESEIAWVRGGPLQVLGLRWWTSVPDTATFEQATVASFRRLISQRDHDLFPILLAHHPHAFDAAAKIRLPLTLAGHTHGGQFMLDERIGAGPLLFHYWSGRYQRGSSQLFVSNGVGNFYPLRVQAPAEVAHITLRRV